MNFKFAKTLLMGSVMTMGAFGLVACGDDSSSGADTSADQPTDAPVVTPSTTRDPSIKAINLSARTPAGSDYVKFSGIIRVDDSADPTAIEDIFKIQSISYDIAKGKYSIGTTYESLDDLTEHADLTDPTGVVDLSSTLHLQANLLENPVFQAHGCGDYTLFIKVIAVNQDGSKVKEYNDAIPFERPAEDFCKVEEVSPTPTVKDEVAMIPCEVELSTHMNPGVNLATCTAVDAASAATADIIIKNTGTATNPEFSVSSGTGLLFASITNSNDGGANLCDDYVVGFWPEIPPTTDIDAWESECPGISTKTSAYVSDFKYVTIDGPSIENYKQNGPSQIYVAKSPAYDDVSKKGFYAFGASKIDVTTYNNGDVGVTLKIYRVQ